MSDQLYPIDFPGIMVLRAKFDPEHPKRRTRHDWGFAPEWARPAASG